MEFFLGAGIVGCRGSGSSAGECILEWEDVDAAKMRVHLKGLEAPDLFSMSCSFWVLSVIQQRRFRSIDRIRVTESPKLHASSGCTCWKQSMINRAFGFFRVAVS